MEFETRHCFFCGPDNPVGLRLRFETVEGGVASRCTVPDRYTGFASVLHGGIVAGLLDEAMWHALFRSTGQVCLTVDMNLRYRRPVLSETELVITGRVGETERRFLVARGTVCDSAGNLLAEAQGRFLPTDPARFAPQSAGDDS